MNGILMGDAVSEGSRQERSNAITDTKADSTACFHKGNASDILSRCQTIAIDMGNKPAFIGLILPNSHGGATPQVAKAILHDAANHLANQGLSTGIGHEVGFLAIIEQEPRICSCQNTAVSVFIERSHALSLQQHLPAIRPERVVLRVVTAQV